MEWTSIINCPYDASFSIAGASTDTARVVTIQLKDFEGKDMTVPSAVIAYLASDEDGLEISGDTPTTDTTIAGGIGCLEVLVTSKVYFLVSEADGDIAVTITDTDTHNYYLVLVMGGRLVVSTIIALAG